MHGSDFVIWLRSNFNWNFVNSSLNSTDDLEIIGAKWVGKTWIAST